MKTITVDKKDYTIEYTFEASLFNECIETTIDLVTSLAGEKKDIKDAINSLSSIPKQTMTLLYAGLLENHSEEIKSVDDAKKLAKKYMSENKDTEDGTFVGLLNTLLECMGDDGFFKQIGLDKIAEDAKNQAEAIKKSK